MVNTENILQRVKDSPNSALFGNDKFLTDVKRQACIFNKFFAEQCIPLKKDSVLPVNQTFVTQSRLSSLDFNEDEILKIIRALNIYEVHGYDYISIRMIKICYKSLTKPLIILLKNSTKSSYYPDIWKRSKIIPVHEKNGKQWVNKFHFYLFLEKKLTNNL